MEHPSELFVRPDELVSFLSSVAYSNTDAANAGTDLLAAVERGVLMADYVWPAIFQDGEEADELFVDSRCFTAALANSVIGWVRTIRAELPALVSAYRADGKG